MDKMILYINVPSRRKCNNDAGVYAVEGYAFCVLLFNPLMWASEV